MSTGGPGSNEDRLDETGQGWQAPEQPSGPPVAPETGVSSPQTAPGWQSPPGIPGPPPPPIPAYGGGQPPPGYPPVYPPQPGYPPAPGYPSGYALTPVAPKAADATSALIWGIVAVVGSFSCIVGGLLGIVAIRLGNRAKAEIAASGGRLQGGSEAKTAVILGWLGIGLFVFWTLLVVMIFAWSFFVASTAPNY